MQIHNYLKGLTGGIILVLSIHSVNALLGCLHLSWPPTPSPSHAIRWFKVYGKILMLAGQGLFMATSVATVEELVFRSWLPKEIAVDLGYHRGIIISGLAFSLFQRYILHFPNDILPPSLSFGFFCFHLPWLVLALV